MTSKFKEIRKRMAHDSFQFKQFTIRQDRCAMKVGTDGTLLGAWAHGGQRILDVGTGTGLIALMMAQRFPEAEVTAIDIDAEAVRQAQENVMVSPFRDRIKTYLVDLRTYPSTGLNPNPFPTGEWRRHLLYVCRRFLGLCRYTAEGHDEHQWSGGVKYPFSHLVHIL